MALVAEEQIITCCDIPDPCCLIAAGRQALAIRRPNYVENRTALVLALIDEQRCTRHGIPDLHRRVSASRSQTLAIRRPSHAISLPATLGVGEQRVTRRGIPDLHRPINAGRSQ